MTQWQAAWERRLPPLQLARGGRAINAAPPRRRYSVAAEVTDQLSRSAAMAHREVVTRVAFKAQAPGPVSLAPRRGLRDPHRRGGAECSSDSSTTKWRVRVGRSEPGPVRQISTSTRRVRGAGAAIARRGTQRQVASRYCDEIRRTAEELYDREEPSALPPRCPTTPPRGGAKGGSKGPAAPAAAAESAGSKRKGWAGNGWERGDGKRPRRGERGGKSSAAGGRWANGR